MKRTAIWLFLGALIPLATACSTSPKSDSQQVGQTKVHPRVLASEPLRDASAKDLSERFSLLDLYSMQSSFWTTSQDAQGNSTVLRFMAFALKPAANLSNPDSGNGRLLVYLEDASNAEKFNVLVDNGKFMWTGIMAGTEPSLSLNRKNSLLIQMGNDGVGRQAWTQTVTAAYRHNQLVVAGYDYTSYDKLQEYPAVECSVNLLTGQIVYQETEMNPGKPGQRIAYRNNQMRRTILLQDWSDQESEAMFAEACKKPVREQKLLLKRNTSK